MSPWRGSIDDDSLGSAWQELAEQAKDKPWLLKLLAERGATLAGRYALWKGRLQRMRQGEKRKLRRRLGVGLAGAALLLALAASPGMGAPAVNMTVTVGSSAVGDGDGCSLPEAIINANNDDQSGSSDCPAGSSADIITLNTDVSLSWPLDSTYGNTGLPVISSPITIEGGGHTISRDSGATVDFRILAVGAGGDLSLNSVTVSGGVAPLSSVTVSGGVAPASALAVAFSNGGGVFVNYGTATVANSTISGNSADYGGGVFVHAGTATVTSSTISGNSAGVSGGGLYVLGHSGDYTEAYVVYSTLHGNTATLSGGGAQAGGYGTYLAVAGSVVAENEAGAGAGLANVQAELIVLFSTISGNSVSVPVLPLATHQSFGAGERWDAQALRASQISGSKDLHRRPEASAQAPQQGSAPIPDYSFNPAGGGVYSYGFYGTVAVAFSTLSGNTATYGGGIAFAYGSQGAVINATLTGNTAISDAPPVSASDAEVIVPQGSGGGLFMYDAEAYLYLNTLVANSADFGGGIALFGEDSPPPSVAKGSTAQAESGRRRRFDFDAVTQAMRAQRAAGNLGPDSASLVGLSGNVISGNIAGNTIAASGLIRPNPISSLGNEIMDASVSGALAVAGVFGGYNVLGHDGETSSQAFVGFAPAGNDTNATSDGDSLALATIVSSALADNDSDILAGVPPGSIVQTLALPAGSPAIDKVASDLCAIFPLALDERGKGRNVNGDGAASDEECDAGAYELQLATVAPRINVHKQTLPNDDPTEFLFKLRGPVGRDFTLADNDPHSTGQIPAGIYTLQEILPPGWDPAIPFDQMTCDDGSPLSAIDLGADEVLICRFLNYKRGNIIVKKVTLPAAAAPSFAMKLIDNTTNKKTLFSLANGAQFDTGAISSVPSYKLLETVPGGWKKKNIVCDNGSPSTAIVIPPGGSVTCTVTNENSAPTNILLSSSSVAENKPAGTPVGTLSASDAIAGDTHTFAFANDGTPAASDNGSFKIVGNQLQTNASFDFETKSSYKIKVKATDTAGQTKVKSFLIKVLDKPG